MKRKILTVLLAFVMMLPVICLAGCFGDSSNKNDSAQDGLSLAVSFKTDYIYGESLNITGGIINNKKDGKNHYVAVTNNMISGFTSSTTGSRKMVLTYDEQTLLVDYTVSYPFETNVKYYAYDVMYFKTFFIFENNSLKMYEFNNKLIYANATNLDQTYTLSGTYDISYSYDSDGNFDYFSYDTDTINAKFTISNDGLCVVQFNKGTSQSYSGEFRKLDESLFNSKICDYAEYRYFGDNCNTNVFIRTTQSGDLSFRIENPIQLPSSESSIICAEQLYVNKFDVKDGKLVYYSNEFSENLTRNSGGGIQEPNTSSDATFYITITQADEDGDIITLNMYRNGTIFFTEDLEAI